MRIEAAGANHITFRDRGAGVNFELSYRGTLSQWPDSGNSEANLRDFFHMCGGYLLPEAQKHLLDARRWEELDNPVRVKEALSKVFVVAHRTHYAPPPPTRTYTFPGGLSQWLPAGFRQHRLLLSTEQIANYRESLNLPPIEQARETQHEENHNPNPSNPVRNPPRPSGRLRSRPNGFDPNGPQRFSFSIAPDGTTRRHRG